jgi:hypothetical protein
MKSNLLDQEIEITLSKANKKNNEAPFPTNSMLKVGIKKKLNS